MVTETSSGFLKNSQYFFHNLRPRSRGGAIQSEMFLSFPASCPIHKTMSELKMHLGKPSAWIEVSGDDSFDFLQGQCANDLRSTSPAPATYSLWLDRKGKVVADSFILQQSPEKIFLLSYSSTAQTLIDRLEPYIIADDVLLNDLTANARLASLWGGDLADALEANGLSLPDPRCHLSGAHWFLFHGRRSAAPNAELVIVGDDAEKRFSALSAAVLDRGGSLATADEMERDRIASGIPAVPADIGPGELPQEGHFEKTALSYEKGCYLGQEVMARIRSMGQVRRSLVQVRIEADSFSPGATLFLGEKEMGVLKSVAPGSPALGFALIKIDALRNSQAFSLQPNEQPAVFVAAKSA